MGIYYIYIMSFAKSLQEKLGDHDPTQVDELILDDLYQNMNSFSSDHEKTLEKYSNLFHLSLNGLGLTSLAHFPKLPELGVLEIRNNKLTGNDFGEIKKLYPSLYKIKVGENPIKSLDVFRAFNETNIVKVELSGTDASKITDYRNTLFKIQSLQSVDGMDRNGDEVESTVFSGEGDDMMEDDMEDFEDDEDFEIDEDDEDFEDDEAEDEDEEEQPKGKKARRE